MKNRVIALLLGLAAVALSSPARAQAFTVYTDSASFFNAFTGGSFTTNFSSVPDFAPITGSTNYSGGGGFSFSVFTTTNDVQSTLFGLQDIPGPGITVYMDNDSLVFTNFSYAPGNGSFGIGGNWFSTDGSGQFQSQPVTVDIVLSDLSTFSTNYTPADLSSTYIGWITSTNISSVTISGPGSASGYYGTAANVTLVPEPSTYALLGLAAAGLAGYAARRRRK